MKTPNVAEVKRGISVLWENLQCPICLDLLTAPVSTKCDHQFCKFCMLKLLTNKQNRASCPVCKAKITKRSLQESPGFQRLVTGLQAMIQAYEQDTGTNYFTGLAQQGHQSGVKDDENSEHTQDTPGTDSGNLENGDKDLPPSHSSTIAAKNEFAKVMGFEDTSPLMTENEGLDSGLGEAIQTSERREHTPEECVEPIEEMSDVVENSATYKTRGKVRNSILENMADPPLTPDESESLPRRRSSRKQQKKEILEQRQKKSVEKVAEWLMKVPIEEGLELEKPADKGSCDSNSSDSGSSSSTLDVRLFSSDVNAQREDARPLEEQVFGAVYKRDRRSSRTNVHPANPFVKSPTPLSTVERQTPENVSRQKKKPSLTPADFVKKSDQNTSEEEEQQMMKRVNDSWIDNDSEVVFKKQSDDKYVEELNNFSESDVVPGLLSENEPHQPETVSKQRTCTLQQIDRNMQEHAMEDIPQKKTIKRRGKLAKSKSTRVPKPLDLVGTQTEETVPKVRPQAKEVQVHIENYPSSEDQETPIMRSNRRSRRLQLFVEEVKKACTPTKVRTNITGKDKIAQEEALGGTLDDTTSPKSRTKVAKRNGCVYNDDLGGVENMELGETFNNVPITETLSETACVVPEGQSSTSPTDAEPEPESENVVPIHIQPETSADDTKIAQTENEEDKNDSEMDTEQLLRSFKATKRKSFHLGHPDRKKSRRLAENVCDTEENSCISSGDKSAQQIEERPDIASKDAVKDDDNSSCSDVIPMSNPPLLMRKPITRKSDSVAVECSIPVISSSAQDMVSSALTPNKVLTHESENPHLSVVPLVVESGLCFQAVELSGCSKRDEFDCTTKESSKEKEIRGNASPEYSDIPGNHCSVSTSENAINTGSLTPDGLGELVEPLVCETKNCGSGELSVYSSIKSNPRKRRRRRAQRLDSSSASDCSGSSEELPTLAQIFKTSAPPSVDEELSSAENRCKEQLSHPPVCPSPNSSQASVDLFGTPDEGDTPVNGTIIESSQFSSEVLVTQQKMEMQKELARLEKLMALVSEVLQEKEGQPSSKVSSETHQGCKTTHPDVQRPHPCEPGECEGPDSVRNAPEGGRGRRPHNGEGVTQAVSKPDGPSETVQSPILAEPSGEGIDAAKTPHSISAARTLKKSNSPLDGQEDKENDTPEKDRNKTKMVLVSSGLEAAEQIMVKKFAKRVGAHVVSQVTSEVTHVIMCTDEQFVCERTLKYFLGIAGRKWVVSFQWISECFKQKKLLDESIFEVRGDVVNGPNHCGPMRARTTEDNNLLMKGFKICFQGTFTDMTTDQMEWMVQLCGAAVAKDPLLLDRKLKKSCQLIIVQPGSASRSATHSSLCKHATVVTRGWLLDSVATYTLQNCSSYTT
ncbi:uncharacterized protein ACBR49_018558 [Aulostomus maculatus]